MDATFVLETLESAGELDGQDVELTLRTALGRRVETLLEGPRQSLLAALYRFDVAEAAARAALRLPTLSDQRDALTRAILDRAHQKIATRRRWADQFTVS
jgi:hypothetical protein